jgi:hypothetical protein
MASSVSGANGLVVHRVQAECGISPPNRRAGDDWELSVEERSANVTKELLRRMPRRNLFSLTISSPLAPSSPVRPIPEVSASIVVWVVTI